jgi:hypothetical protein
VAVAPASGVNTGKAILFKPANSGHQSLTIWGYRANRAAVEMIIGARVKTFSADFKAGEPHQREV